MPSFENVIKTRMSTITNFIQHCTEDMEQDKCIKCKKDWKRKTEAAIVYRCSDCVCRKSKRIHRKKH